MNGQDEFDDILKNKLDSQEFPFDPSNWEKASGMIDASRNALRDKLDAEEFPFDEANWQKAAAMIDASREKKRRPAAIYFIAAGLLLILSLAGWFLFNTSDATTPISQLTDNTTKTGQTASAPVAETDNGATAPSANQTATQSEAAEKSAPSETAKAEHPETAIAPAEKIASETKRTSHPATSKLPEKSSVKNSRTPALSASTDDLSTDLSKKISSGAHDQSAARATAAKKEAGYTTTSNGSSTEAAAIQAEGSKENTGKAPLTPVISKEAITPAHPEINSGITLGTTTTVDSAAKTPVVAALPVKVDTAVNIVAIESKFRTEKEPRSFIYAEAGTNYLLGWRNLDEKDASGFNPVFGLHFFHMFKNKLGITAGSQYNCVGNLNYSSHTSTVTHYDFGKVDDVTIITPTKIHYVSGILKLNYVIKKNNIIGIGCNISYLLNVDNKVETYNERDNHISQVQISKTNGYVDGFKTLDVQATLSYRRMLYKDFGASIELFYGLTDVKTNGFFNTNFFERNSGMKLTLTYNIFKK